MYGFGHNNDEETGPVLKICAADEAKQQKLAKVIPHNLASERQVGYINYELSIRGKSNLKCSFRNMILKKCGFTPEM